MLTPYSPTPVQSTITELYVDPTTLKARVQWSNGSAPRSTSSVVGIPTALAIGSTYLIMGEVSYLYVPTVGYVMSKSGINADLHRLYAAASDAVRYLSDADLGHLTAGLSEVMTAAAPVAIVQRARSK